MLKYSRQRESIKEFLDKNRVHPTAETIYTNIKKAYPNISLGTVYRNLNLLADMGEILRIPSANGPDHFDGNCEPHYHFICTQCQNVMDIPLDPQLDLEAMAGKNFKGCITGHEAQFYGLCPNCNQEISSEKHTS